MAVQFDTLLVDEDTNAPVDSAPYYKDALDANGIDYGYWDLAENPALPPSYLAAHQNAVWFTGNSYPAPLGGYERELTAFLNGGGRLFMSGQDILDQAAGTHRLRPRLPAHRLGRDRGPERQGHQLPCTASTATR